MVRVHERDTEAQDDGPDQPDGDDDERRVVVERMAGFDEWEFYRLFAEDVFQVVCTVAMRPDHEKWTVEYAVWREGIERDDPGATGTVEQRTGTAGWGNESREDALRQVIYRYEDDIGVTQDRLGFQFEAPPDDVDGVDDEIEEDDDEE